MPRPVPLRTVHCGRCWATYGGAVDAAEIAAPPLETLGSRDPVDQREWPALLAAEPWVQDRRRDCREKLLRLVRELTIRADWDTWETWPGWDRLMEASTWARSTLADWLRQLRLLGWLSVIESGSTPQFRPMALAHVEGNRRAVYALRIPRRPGETYRSTGRQSDDPGPVQAETVVPGSELEKAHARAAWRSFATGHGTLFDQGKRGVVDKTWTPTWFFNLYLSVGSWVSSRAREIFHNSQVNALSEPKIEGLRPRFDEEYRAFSARVPTTGPQMLAAAAELRRQQPVLARLTIRAVRALCRPYWRAQWTNDDLLHGLEYRPTSWSTLPAMDPAKVLAPYQWCQSRLTAWRTDTGRVLPGHSRREHDRNVRERAVAARHGRAALAALPAGAGQLRPLDIRRRGQQQHEAAVDLLRRRRAAELTAVRAATRPPELAASPDTAAQMSARIRAEMRERLLAQARTAPAAPPTDDGQVQDGPELTWTPPRPGETPADRYELARARAEFEGRLSRAGRRRNAPPGPAQTG